MVLVDSLKSVASFIAIVSVPCWFVYSQTLKSETTRQHLIDKLNTGRARNLYQQGVNWFLNRVQKIYGGKGTIHALGISLTIAYFYPLLLWLFSYSFLGGSEEFAGTAILPKQTSYRELYFPGYLLFLALFLFFVRLILLVINIVERKILYMGLAEFLLASSTRFVTTIITLIIGVTGAAISFYIGINASRAATVFVVIAVTGVFAGFVALVVGHSGVKTKNVDGNRDRGLPVAGVGAVFLASGFAFSLGPFFINNDDKGSYVSIILALFFVCLPMINALFDWLSWWISRLFLERTRDEPKFPIILLDIGLDLLAGLGLLIALSILLPLTAIGLDMLYAHFTSQDGPFVHTNWFQIAIDARDDPWGKGFIVTMMLITTLLPTMLHIFMGLTALLVRGIYGKNLALFLDKKDINNNFDNVVATFWIISYFAASLLLMVLISWGLSQLFNIQISQWLFDLILTKQNISILQ